MTLDDLILALKPITDAAIAEQEDRDVVHASVVLAALTGALAGPDREFLAALARHAGNLCNQRNRDGRGTVQ